MVDKKEIFNFLGFSALILTIMFIIPFTIGLTTGDFGFQTGESTESSILQEFQFFMIAGAIGWIIIVSCYIAQIILTKGDNTYGDSVGLVSLGQVPSLKLFRRFTIPQLLLLGLILFSTVFLFANISNTQSFTGLKVLPQQFTATQSLLFSSAQIPIAENLVAGSLIAVCLLFLGVLARKYNFGKTNYIILAYFIPFIIGIFGVSWHSAVYPNSQIALITVFFFWTIGAFLSILSGFWGLFWIMHFMNNFFIDISRYLTSQNIVFYIGFTIVSMILLYLWIYRGKYFGRSQN